MNWQTITKFVIRTVASTSVSRVVRNVVEHTAPSDLDRLGQISTAIGGFIISAAVGEMAGNYVMNEVERIVPSLKDPQTSAE